MCCRNRALLEIFALHSLQGRGRAARPIRACGRARIASLTPRHRLRQLEPSLLVKGHTTSLLASETENELVSEVRGGMVGGAQSLRALERGTGFLNGDKDQTGWGRDGEEDKGGVIIQWRIDSERNAC